MFYLNDIINHWLMATQGMSTGYKTVFQHRDIQSPEDLNLISHTDLRGMKTRNGQASVQTNDICRGFHKYICDVPYIILLFLRGRKTVCKIFQSQRQ